MDAGTVISLTLGGSAVLVALLSYRNTTRNDFKKEALKEGVKNALIEEMRDDIKNGGGLLQEVAREALKLRTELDVVKTDSKKTGDVVQQHLIDCAKSQGRIEQKLDDLTTTTGHLNRGVEALQRQLGNLMQRGTVIK